MGDVAIVTGGSRGIGRATAIKLAQLGYAVVVNYASNTAAADAVVSAITSTGGKAVAVKGDVAKESDVLELFAAAERLGTVKVVVNNAGIMEQVARFEDMTTERMARVVAVNVTGAMICAREAVRCMSTKRGGAGGAIVNLGSAASVLGGAGFSVDYAATKGAIDTLTIGLGREVAAEGIRVNAVRPGIIDTEIHEAAGMPGRPQKMREQIPIGREGSAEEVADVIVWLCGPHSSYVTGTIVAVAGGRC
jgi:NAD(P)-dependent dehydrogenase (short-subunit alcohol dehydrogenase family)